MFFNLKSQLFFICTISACYRESFLNFDKYPIVPVNGFLRSIASPPCVPQKYFFSVLVFLLEPQRGNSYIFITIKKNIWMKIDHHVEMKNIYPAQVARSEPCCEDKVLTVSPDEKAGWYFLKLSGKDMKLFCELLSGARPYKVREYQRTVVYRFLFKTFVYTTANHRKRMEDCTYSETEFQKHMSASRYISDFEGQAGQEGAGKKMPENAGGGYLFVYAPIRKLNKVLRMITPHRFAAMDFITHKAARIPDGQMKDFVQIYESLPWDINILKYPISRYAGTHQRIRITGGVLKGLEGFIVRMHRDRNLVFSFGSMTLSIGGIHALPFKVIV
jgi:hypothetical protein